MQINDSQKEIYIGDWDLKLNQLLNQIIIMLLMELGKIDLITEKID